MLSQDYGLSDQLGTQLRGAVKKAWYRGGTIWHWQSLPGITGMVLLPEKYLGRTDAIVGLY